MTPHRQAFARGEMRLRQPFNSAAMTCWPAESPFERDVVLRLNPRSRAGTERLRLPPTSLHSDNDIEALVTALSDVWTRLTLRCAA